MSKIELRENVRLHPTRQIEDFFGQNKLTGVHLIGEIEFKLKLEGKHYVSRIPFVIEGW